MRAGLCGSDDDLSRWGMQRSKHEIGVNIRKGFVASVAEPSVHMRLELAPGEQWSTKTQFDH